MKITEDGGIQLYLGNVTSSLNSLGGKLSGFTIAGKDRVLQPANCQQ